MQENGEDSYAMQTEENLEEHKENYGLEADAELEDAPKNGKNLKKRSRKKMPSGAQGTSKKAASKETPKKTEVKEPMTPASDRPTRERKSIDRFADSIEEKEKPKEFKIEQGAGSCLRDIPNVVFKLSKRKTSDEPVQLLHKLLYNKKVKPHQVKSNILQFSGCVWGPNEEKEKAKMKDKLEKCVKDNLWQVSDLLDLNITKTTKKEDLVLQVLEFMDSPHKTTEKLLEEVAQKSKEKKRSRTPSKGKGKKSPGQTPRKRQKPNSNEDTEPGAYEDGENQDDAEEEPEEVPEEEPKEAPAKKKSIKIKEPRHDAKPNSSKKQGKKSAKKPSQPDIEDEEEQPEEQAEEPDEDEEPKKKPSKNKNYEEDVASKSPKKSTPKPDVSKSPKKGAQRSAKPESVYEPREEDLDDDTKGVKSKLLSKVSKKSPSTEVKIVAGSSSKEKKKASSGSSKASSKKSKEEQEEVVPPVKVPKKARGTNNADAKDAKSTSIPPDEDLRAAICELLRDADFSTVTFTDVVKQLGAKFNVDLSQNKAHVKNLIQEEISKIVDEDDGEGENEEAAGIDTQEKDEKEAMVED